MAPAADIRQRRLAHGESLRCAAESPGRERDAAADGHRQAARSSARPTRSSPRVAVWSTWWVCRHVRRALCGACTTRAASSCSRTPGARTTSASRPRSGSARSRSRWRRSIPTETNGAEGPSGADTVPATPTVGGARSPRQRRNRLGPEHVVDEPRRDPHRAVCLTVDGCMVGRRGRDDLVSTADDVRVAEARSANLGAARPHGQDVVEGAPPARISPSTPVVRASTPRAWIERYPPA